MKFSTRKLTAMGLLIALEVVLSRFLSINAWNIKIGLSFLPVAAAGILLGPLEAGIVAALADFLGALLFPIGAYFPGFTLTAFLTGLVYGLFLRSGRSFWRVAAAVGINQGILSLLLNTWWISLLYGSPYGPLLATRVVQCIILTVLQAALIPVLDRGIRGRFTL